MLSSASGGPDTTTRRIHTTVKIQLNKQCWLWRLCLAEDVQQQSIRIIACPLYKKIDAFETATIAHEPPEGAPHLGDHDSILCQTTQESRYRRFHGKILSASLPDFSRIESPPAAMSPLGPRTKTRIGMTFATFAFEAAKAIPRIGVWLLHIT